MAARMWSGVIALIVVTLAHGALAQDKPLELTPAGKAILQDQLATDRAALNNPSGPIKPATFPLAICAFPGGLCGAVNRDGTVAVRPQYDWVGKFSDNRAAVRLGGLYGFVDQEGREIVKPQYRIVDDYKFGFAQVDVDGKSGLIDRDGKMVIEPKYGFVEAIAPDRFRVLETRQLGGPSAARTSPVCAAGPPRQEASAFPSLSKLNMHQEASLISPDDGLSRLARGRLARSTRTIRRSAGCSGTSCGAWRAPTGAGWSSRSSRM
jgi:WG containing repeat